MLLMHGTNMKNELLNLTLYGEVDWGDISVEFDVADQLLIMLRMRQILNQNLTTVKQHFMYCRLQCSQ